MARRLAVVAALVALGAGAWWAFFRTRPGTASGGSGGGGAEQTPIDALGLAGTDDAGRFVVDSKPVDAGLPRPTLNGEVRDATGGVAQADVQVRLRGETTEKGCATSADTRSVAGGAFEVGTLCPGQYDVRVLRGPLAANQAVRLKRGDTTFVTLSLREGTRLTVRVQDTAKAPLAGAEVHVQDSQTGFSSAATTDARGTVLFEGLVPHPHSVWARKGGYLEASINERMLSGGDDGLSLTLTAGVGFEVRVVGPDGEGVDEAWVRLGTRKKELGHGFDSVAGGDTADGGYVSLGPMLKGSYVALVTHDRYPRLERPVRVPGPPLTLQLGRGAAIEGMFLDADGAPILSEADVHAEEGGTADSRNTHLDEGRFRLDGLSRGAWVVIGLAQSRDGGAQGVAVAQVALRDEQTQQVTLQLQRGETITGRCVNGDGSRADTDVVAIDETLLRSMKLNGLDVTRVAPGSAALSSCNDRFSLSGLKAGRTYALISCGNDDQPPTARAGDRDVVVKCQEGTLRLRAVDPQGRPVTKYQVDYGSLTDFPDGVYQGSVSGELDRVVTVRAPGFAPLQRVVKATRAERIDLGNLVLQPARKVAGRVVDARDGRGVFGAELTLGVDGFEAVVRARTRSDGTFELDDVASEDSRIFVTHPEFLPRTEPLPASTLQLVITLNPGLKLTGAVITRDGRTPADYQVEARHDRDVTAREAAVVDGHYELGSLSPGEWRLRLTGSDVSGFDPQTVTLFGSGGVTADFVERLGGISVTVMPLDDEGHPVVALAWLLFGRRAPPSTDGDAWQLALGGLGSEGDSSGSHTFHSVAPGTWTVLVRAKELKGLVWLETFEVHSGMPSPLRVLMPRGLQPLP